MKSSFDGSCAFDGSSLGNVIKPSMASLGGCALDDDEVASALENHRLSRGDRKRRKASECQARHHFMYREEEGSKSVFLLWITVRRVSSEKT